MVKNIIVKGKLRGNGIVNYDSADYQKDIVARRTEFLKGINVSSNGSKVSNIKLAKKCFYGTGEYDEKGNEIIDYLVQISRDCLGYNIFGHPTNPVLCHNELAMVSAALSPVELMKGYLRTVRSTKAKESINEKNEDAFTRKSAITIVKAMQCNDAKTYMEVGTRFGERDSTSMRYTESAGLMEYEFLAEIRVKELQFISADPFLGQRALNSDWHYKIKCGNGTTSIPEIFDNYYHGMEQPVFGNFALDGNFTSDLINESGYLLSNDIQEYIVKETLKKIFGLDIKRRDAYASMVSMKVKVVEDITTLGRSSEDENGFVEINSVDEIDSFVFPKFFNFYKRVDQESVDRRDKAAEEKSLADAATKENKRMVKEEVEKKKKSKS